MLTFEANNNTFSNCTFPLWFLKHCALQHLYSSFGSRWSQSYLEYLSSRCLEYSIDRSGGPKLSEKNISENTDGRAAAAAAYTTMLFPKTSKLYYIIITIIYYLTRNLLVRHLHRLHSTTEQKPLKTRPEIPHYYLIVRFLHLR